MVRRGFDQWAGAKDGWRANLALRAEQTDIELDATRLRFAVPTFLLRLRAFAEWHTDRGHRVKILCPPSHVGTYMALMEIDRGLPKGTFVGLPKLPSTAKPNSDVLIPITQLREFEDVDRLGEKLVEMFLAHSDDVAVFANAMHLGVSELCGNAVEHGANPLGCYVAAQRYERPHRHVVLALGDLGIGIPSHMRRRFKDLKGDRRALRRAVKEGVTATGKAERGIGFSSLMEGALGPQTRYATLDLHSGRASLRREVRRDASGSITETASAPNKLGTWATFELGPLN